MADEAVFTYFDGRGRGELVRIALSFAKIPVRQKRKKKKPCLFQAKTNYFIIKSKPYLN